MHYWYCPGANLNIEMFHGVTGSTSRLELGLCRFDSWPEQYFSARLVSSFRARSSRVVLVHLSMASHVDAKSHPPRSRAGDMFCVGNAILSFGGGGGVTALSSLGQIFTWMLNHR